MFSLWPFVPKGRSNHLQSGHRSRARHRRRLEVEQLEDRRLLAQILVTTIEDNGNDDEPTPNSLREAIKTANATPAEDTIIFNIGGGEQRIAVANNTKLPTIVHPLIIDGSPPEAHLTQVIVLDGTVAKADASGLVIGKDGTKDGSGSTVKGLRIMNFPKNGILIENTGSNTIGGSAATEAQAAKIRNIISKNGENGILITGADAKDNKVLNTYIGTSADGLQALANQKSGVAIEGGASSNTIGALGEFERNVISGNTLHGVDIVESHENTVSGNYLGTKANGTEALPNLNGIRIVDGTGNIIGAEVTTVGGVIQNPANVISGNTSGGIFISGGDAKSNKIWGNFIGTDKNGENKLGNGFSGVGIDGSKNVIGGTAQGERNVISGNGNFTTNKGSGVVIFGGPGVDGNVIENNNIGTGRDRANKALDLGNAEHGVEFGLITTGNVVKDNLIGHNKKRGVRDPAQANKIRQEKGSIFSNGIDQVGLGIDIGPDGPTPDGRPTLTSAVVSAGNIIIQGFLTAAPDTDYDLEFFANVAADSPLPYGEGEEFIGGWTVRTDSNGHVDFTTSSFLFQAAGTVITATATSAAENGNTSEFSRAIQAYEPNTIGDFVWDDLNANGVWDPYEPGRPDVTVNLYDEFENWLDFTTTDSGGYYLFSDVAPGTYFLEFFAPTGFEFSPPGIGTDPTIDSDADPMTGRTAAFTFNAGESNPNLDAGLYQKATVGDFVWDDLDGNGVQDPGEPGYDGVTVRLLDQGGAVISSTSTSGGGFYSFPDLIPGTYSLEFVAPAGYGFTSPDAGDDALDSDVDPATGLTAPFTLSSGQNETTLDAGLFLNDLPAVTGIVPNFGPLSGGTTVTLSGLNFLAVTDVSFGGTAASFTVDSSTQITATAPPNAAGTVDVTVTTASGTSPATPADWFTYVDTPIRTEPGFSASNLGPTDDGSAGPIDLGFTLDFFGQLYSTVYVNNNGNVTFDGPLVEFTPFDLTTSTIPILAPFFADVDTNVGPVVSYGTGTVDGHAAFAVNWIAVGYFAQHLDKTNSFQLVLIDRSDLAPGAFDVEFNYGRIEWETGDASEGVEGLGGLSARAGYANGSGNPGTSHELAGSGANGAFLDSNPTTGLIHNSQNSGGVLGRYVYEVRGGGGGGGGAAAFSEGGTAPAAASSVPVVRGVKTIAGPTAGGTRVSIIGNHFTGVSGVFFGTTPASSFTVISPQRIIATAPPYAAGTLNVRVTTTGGSSLPVPVSRFSYVAAPVVTGLSQTSGSTRGGTAVTLTGTNFTGVTAVLFGTTPARSFRVLSPTQIAVIAPPRLPGTVEVRVAAAGGVSTASPVARYTYVAVPRVTGLSRSSGPTAGGFSLTLTGANFLGVTAVLFGSQPAAFTVQSPTRVTVVVPPGAAGPVNVRIVAAGGSSPVSPATRFTYVAGPAAGLSSAPAGSSGSGTLASGPLDPFSVDLVMALQHDADSEQP